MWRVMIRLLLVLAVLYGCYAGYYFMIQRSILFPVGLIPAPPATTADGDIIWLNTPSGRVESILLPPLGRQVETPAPVLLIAHGNAETIRQWVPAVDELRRSGWAVYLVEYPGYGASDGRPSQRTITDAYLAAYDRLTSRPGIDPSRIVLFGRSLGSGAVCALAARCPAAALILLSGFTSIRDFAVRMGLPGFLVRDPFDNISVLAAYNRPVLILHGRTDRDIPFDHARRLHAAAPRSTLIELTGGHNDCVPDWPRFWNRHVLPFLEQAAPEPD